MSAPRIGSLCSGYGGLDAAVRQVFGGELAWVADPDPGAAAILAHRHPSVPNLGDITRTDWSAAPPVDILAAGFPCQDVSVAGRRAGVIGDIVLPAGAMICGECKWADHDPETCEAASPSGAVPSRLTGPAAAAAVAALNAADLANGDPPPERVIKGNRSGLWSHIAHAISILNPRIVVIENVRGLLSAPADRGMGPDGTPVAAAEPGPLRALGAVLGDLADLGFDAEWVGVRASDIGAPHRRERVFLLAWPADSAGPGLEAGREGRPGGDTAADTPHLGHQRGGLARDRWAGSADGGDAAADAPGDGRQQGRPEPAGFQRGPDAAERGRTAAPDADDRSDGQVPHGGPAGAEGDHQHHGLDAAGRVLADARWGPYAAAVARWEHVVGRPAPAPTEPGRSGNPRLSPRFVEWLMGLAPGCVTDVPGLTRTQQLRALGNGVVPQQAVHALRLLADRLPAVPRLAVTR
ncbi:DNA cytosine methyltransferase [Streptomyces xiamenensis]|uniref:DNA cytosine methyltransferase n=1 Tax=Streptomyces xiamenensis TaxID=408015 RepID=UPI0035D62182